MICKLSSGRPWIYDKKFFAHERKIDGLTFLIEIILTTSVASTMDVLIAEDGLLEGFT